MPGYDKREFAEEETNDTLQDIKKMKGTSRRAGAFLWRSTKKLVLLPGYLKHQGKMRITRQRIKTYEAYVIPFLEPSECVRGRAFSWR